MFDFIGSVGSRCSIEEERATRQCLLIDSILLIVERKQNVRSMFNDRRKCQLFFVWSTKCRAFEQVRQCSPFRVAARRRPSVYSLSVNSELLSFVSFSYRLLDYVTEINWFDQWSRRSTSRREIFLPNIDRTHEHWFTRNYLCQQTDIS